MSFREGRPARNGQSPGPSPPLGVRDLHVSPGPSSVHARTPTRGSGAVARHHYRWGWQDDRHDLHRTKDDIQDDCDARRLPTVYFLQCPTTVPPRFRGKRRLPCSHSCTPPILITIKGGGGLPLAGLVSRSLASLFQEDVQGLLSTHLNRLHF